MAAPSALDLFHPRVRRWFEERVGTPTEIQQQAWPEIAAGHHVLATAPTGSGKTLTAFLWALDRLLSGAWQEGGVRVLYLSPLKALNSDIRRNLELPLAELRERFRAAGSEPPRVRALTRSGDTPQNERQRLIKKPPEILITTPESLNILLTSQGGRSILGGLETVILDEIHAVAGSKRGTHLMTAVERLTRLSGEFQRIALSATVRPLERIARFVGGYEVQPVEGGAHYRPRAVRLLRSTAQKEYSLQVKFPVRPEEDAEPGAQPVWDSLAPDFRRTIRSNQSTLLFANNRRLTERLTRLINDEQPSPLAYSHHGSLSKEVRKVVEERLKAGELKAIVATSSLELGIDIGDLDEVLLLQTPQSVSAAVQRIGRSGHRVGEVSRGALYPTFGRDFLQAAVVARAVVEQEIEEVQPISNPLDVLAQVLLSMLVAETWRLDDLYDFIRGADAYHDLSRRQFDLVLEMLAGRYADTRLRELKPRISIDQVEGTARARPGAARLLYLAGGTIPDRGYFTLRIKDSMTRLGELDEEFVWERSLGDSFVLGAQSWRIVQITHNDVLVAPARGRASLAPFWRADELDRDYFLSEKVGRFLKRADAELGSDAFRDSLQREHRMSRQAALSLIEFLEEQRSATGGMLPHRHRLLVERLGDAARGSERQQVILHTFWGGTVNRPLSLALAAAWEERYPDEAVEVWQDDDCIALSLPNSAEPEELLGLVPPEQVEALLRRRLESTGFFGAHFRKNAGRALLLPRAGFRHRTPLWLNRMRSKKLLESVSRFGDFPVVVETWRTCLQDAFDLETLKRLLGEVDRGEIEVVTVRTESASPFAAGLVWKQTNQLMYEDDTPEGDRRGGLKTELLRELVLSAGLRPTLGGGLIDEFQRKVQRLWPGYSPRDGLELVEWVKERLWIPLGEWGELRAAVERDHGANTAEGTEVVDEEWIAERLLRWRLAEGEPAVVAVESLPRLARAFDLDPAALAGGEGLRPLAAGEENLGVATRRALSQVFARAAEAVESPETEAEEVGDDGDFASPRHDLLAEWARFYGPFEPHFLAQTWGLDDDELAAVLEALVEDQRWVVDRLRKGSQALEICDAENLETLLRWSRVAARPSFEALPAEHFPLFLATHQGLTAPGSGLDDLQDRLEQLLGLPVPAAFWESEILPARLVPYYPSWMDTLVQESELIWLGSGKERLLFTFPGDLDLLADEGEADEAREEEELDAEERALLEALGPDPRAGLDLVELAQQVGTTGETALRGLWGLVWKGRVRNESFVTLRRAALQGFKALPATAAPRSGGARPTAGRRGGRRRFQRWRSAQPATGRWFPVPPPDGAGDALDREERVQERVRLLLGRYGILFRPLLARELAPLGWSRVFRSLRILELAGEVLAGHFFADLPGPQFIAPKALRALRQGLPEDATFWLNAADPASPCGLDAEALRGRFPRRHPSTHLAFLGTRLVVVSKRLGKELEIEVPPDHPRLLELLAFLKVLVGREFNPLKAVEIETVNGEPARTSPYVGALEDAFHLTRDYKSVHLRKRY